MKKTYLTIIALVLLINLSYAQWSTVGTNTIAASKVYIGNNSSISAFPSYPFRLNGSWNIGDFSGVGTVFSGNSSTFNFGSSYYYSNFFNITPNGVVSFGDFQGNLNSNYVTVDDNASTITFSSSNGINFNTPSFGFNASAPLADMQLNGGFEKLCMGNASSAALHYGTGYVGFNAARMSSGSGWRIDGDGSHNGGGVAYASIFGDLYFAPIASTSGTAKTLLDNDIAANIQFRVSQGVAYAKQLYVETSGWPDYLFNPGYKLPSLSSLRKYIDRNNHLPELPSAGSVDEKGIDVGETNKILLKKIEQLTLYLIKQDKAIRQREQILKNLEKSL